MEIWKEAYNFNGYAVSNMGRIMSLPHITTVAQRNRVYDGIFGGNIIKPSIKNAQSKSVQVLLVKDGLKFSRSLGRLVYETFNGELPLKKRVKHINGDPLDNNLSNLTI